MDGENGGKLYGYIFPEAMTRQNVTAENKILYVQSMVTGAGVKGNFVFPIKSESLKNLMRDTYVSGPGWAYVKDGEGNVLLTVPSEQGEFEAVPDEYLENGKEIQKVQIGSRKMEIIQAFSKDTGLAYVAVLPMEYIMVQVSVAQKRNMGMMLLVLAAGLGSILGVSWYRGRKIDGILQMLFKVEGSDEELKGDEMTYISQSLKQLIENNSDLRENIRKQEPITRGLMLESVLRGGNTEKELDKYGICLTGRKMLVIAYQIEEEPVGELKVDAGETVVYKQILLKKLNEIFGGEQYGCDTGVGSGAVICVMTPGQDCGKEQFAKPLEELCGRFWEKEGIRVRIAVGSVCENAEMISKSYDKVCEMLQYGTDADRFAFFYEDYMESKDCYYFPVTLEERLVNAVRSGNMDGMHEQLKEVYQVNVMERSISPSMMHFLVNDLQCSVIKVLHSLKGHIEIDEEEIYTRLEQLLRESDILLRFHRINQIFRYICEKVQEETNEDKCHQREAMEKYIRENYSDSDLSLIKIADDFGYASTYFSKLFKELFQENFVNYLERVRIEEVCRLLGEGMKLEEIAGRTGYNSVYVMRTAFKRIKGMTPNEYRKSGQRKE